MMRSPSLAPELLYRCAQTVLGIVGVSFCQVTTQSPSASMATAGLLAMSPSKSTTIAGPSVPPDASNIWARMSWSVLEYSSSQTTTERPLAALALSELSWALRVVVFTENSEVSDRSCRPSRASRSRRARRGRRASLTLAARSPFFLKMRDMFEPSCTRDFRGHLSERGDPAIRDVSIHNPHLGRPSGRDVRHIDRQPWATPDTKPGNFSDTPGHGGGAFAGRVSAG